MDKPENDNNNKVISIRPRPAIAGKVAIITGASSGIGESTARAFAEAGATVILAARRADRLLDLQTEITNAGGIALAVPTDLRKRDQITHLVKTTLESFSRIDILANIAGWGRYDWFEELSHKDFRDQFEVNVLGLGELTRQVIPTMKAQHSGYIVMMNSYASEISVPPLTVYSSTKHALVGLSDGLRRELLPWGIQVMSVHAGGVTGTEFNKQAGKNGGIRFKSPPIGKVTREQVARQMVALVENPKRSAFLGRPYEIPVFIDRMKPELVDAASSFWVRLKQRKNIGQPLTISRSRAYQFAAGMVGVLAAITIARSFILTRVMHR